MVDQRDPALAGFDRHAADDERPTIRDELAEAQDREIERVVDELDGANLDAAAANLTIASELEVQIDRRRWFADACHEVRVRELVCWCHDEVGRDQPSGPPCLVIIPADTDA